MKNNQPPLPVPANWAPEYRMLWLAKHDAPSNMRLVTDIELHMIDRGLNAERVKALDYEKRCAVLEKQIARLEAELATAKSILNEELNCAEKTESEVIRQYARAERAEAKLKAKP